MRTLSKNELNNVAGATIVINQPSGTTLQGITKDIFDPHTGEISKVLLYSWKTHYSGDSDHTYCNQELYYFNENVLSSMPKFNDYGCSSYNWIGFVP